MTPRSRSGRTAAACGPAIHRAPCAHFSTCARAGRELARPLLETVLDVNRRAIAEGDRSFPPVYEDVAVHAMLGNREAALAAWERAVEMGWPEPKVDVYDPLIAPVKDDPRFIAALDRAKRRVAEMFARVDVKTLDEWIARGAPVNPVR